MRWRPLSEFRDERIGKLARLRVAARRGLAVPPTVWARAADLVEGDVAPPAAFGPPWIVRSAAPDEDGGAGSAHGTAAGRYLSVAAEDRSAFAPAVHAVAHALRAANGTGAAVFVQPLLIPEAGGVAFFDGFSYERAETPGGNRGITAGDERGEVTRADLARGEAWSRWLARVGAVFGAEAEGGAALDIEYARSGDAYTLLQVRPAQFRLRRNPLLSLANHREILGSHPSPWVTSALVRAGRGALEEFARIDPVIAQWDGQYAEECAGRAWLSFSFFFRLMDHWGLPRTFVTEGVGGEAGGPEDARPLLGRMLRSAPKLVRLQLQNRRTIRGIPRALAAFDRRLAAARTVEEWFDATVFGLDLALRTNFAINGAWTGIARVRRALGIRGRARVVTEEMMESYEGIAECARDEREAALDRWLGRFGHRGPLESDPLQPRFRELRASLLVDVLARSAVESAPARARTRAGLLFRIDRVREQFRDDLMRRWETLRAGILAAAEDAARAGSLERAEDVFLLDGDAACAPERFRDAVRAARARREEEAAFDPPLTARREAIEAAVRASTAEADPGASEAGATRAGIGVGDGVARGTVRRASELLGFLDFLGFLGGLAAGDGPAGPVILVVPALEPSWSVAFGRVAGVVTEIGGELSHASILLRESRTPAVVNCHGAARWLRDGDEVELDANAGVVRLLARPAGPAPGQAPGPASGAS